MVGRWTINRSVCSCFVGSRKQAIGYFLKLSVYLFAHESNAARVLQRQDKKQMAVLFRDRIGFGRSFDLFADPFIPNWNIGKYDSGFV